MMINCLGLNYVCGEYWWIFTIAELLTVIGLFFTWYQFIWEREKFRLLNRWLTSSTIFIAIWWTVLISIVWIIVNYIPGRPLPIIGYSESWNLLALLFIITIGSILSIGAIRPLKKIKNKEHLLDIIISFIGKGGLYTTAIWGELRYIIRDIINLENKGDVSWYLYRMFQILLDKSLIDNIIHEQIFTLNEILSVYKIKNDSSDANIDRVQKQFISTIIEESLNSKDSIISKEIRWELYAGINKWQGIVTQQIFNDFYFIHRYQLLSRKWYMWSYRYEQDKGEEYDINYSKFWKLSIESFFRESKDNKGIIHKDILKNIDFYEDISNGLMWFAWYKGILVKNYRTHDIIYTMLNKIKKWISENAQEILDYYQKIDIWLSEVENIIQIEERRPSNFFEAIALWCYSLLESMSYIDNIPTNSENIRDIIVNYIQIDDSLSTDIAVNKVFQLINERLKYLILKKIEERNIKGYYPNMTRNFFYMYWYQIFTNKIAKNDEEFCFKVLQLLELNLPKLYSWTFWWITEKWNTLDKDLQEARREKINKIIEDILPYGIIYNQEKNTLTYYFADRLDKSVLDLSEVKNNKIIILNNDY